MSEQLLQARAARVIEWANLYGDDLAGKLRLDEDDDAETLEVIEDALWCAHAVDDSLRASAPPEVSP